MSPRNSVVMIGVLIVFLAACVHGFLLDTYWAPCSYWSWFSGTTIYCNAKALHSIPVFHLTGYTYDCPNILDFGNNYITIIGNDAFIQLRTLDCHYYIFLNNNSISQIDEYAFRGIEANIIGLSLQKNSLNHLPEAIGSIIYLRYLNLNENPIVSLDPSVMAKIGHSLIEFRVGMASFNQWPTELHFLNKLKELKLDDIPFQVLDSSAFRGLTNVGSLAIMGSNFRKIPNAICTLSALSSLQIDNNYLLNESQSDAFEPCSLTSGTPHVTRIKYQSNRVDFFPNILTMFPSVEAMHMDSNGMRFMNADKFVDNFSVLELELTNNSFRQIPSGLNAFKSLYSLKLDHNVIEFIEDNDLIGLRSLNEIYLAYNPIQFITDRAFQNNMQLTWIDLSHTLLTTIPAAVTMLPALQSLFFDDNDIECTCKLASLKNWNLSHILILGQCYQTNQTIDQFIKTDINRGMCYPVHK